VAVPRTRESDVMRYRHHPADALLGSSNPRRFHEGHDHGGGILPIDFGGGGSILPFQGYGNNYGNNYNPTGYNYNAYGSGDRCCCGRGGQNGFGNPLSSLTQLLGILMLLLGGGLAAQGLSGGGQGFGGAPRQGGG